MYLSLVVKWSLSKCLCIVVDTSMDVVKCYVHTDVLINERCRDRTLGYVGK